MRPTRIAIIDPDELRQHGLHDMLREVPGWQVTGVYGNLCDFDETLADKPVSVVVLSDLVPRGVELGDVLAGWRCRLPGLQVIIIGHNLSMRHIQSVFQHGVQGFIHRPDCSRSTLIACIDSVLQNQLYVSPRASAELYRRDAVAQALHLRQSDLDVLKCLHEGLNTQEIALRLAVDERTIYRSRNRLRQVLNVRINEQIIPEAIRRGLLDASV